MNNEQQLNEAQARIGQRATMKRGLLRGVVTVQAAKWAYGRTLFLVSNDRGEHEWVNAASLDFNVEQQ